MNIAGNILDTVGNTPLVKVNKLNKSFANVLAKVEFFNPGGSAKDRVALFMLNDAEQKGGEKAHIGGVDRALTSPEDI